jgi:hypothetical protein
LFKLLLSLTNYQCLLYPATKLISSLSVNTCFLRNFAVNLSKMDERIYNPILVRYGGAKKSIFEMNNEEMLQAAQSILRRARENAFSKGLPIYFSQKGILMAEYPDGRVEIVKKDA